MVSVWPGFVRTERIDVGAAAGLLPASLDLEHRGVAAVHRPGGGRPRHRSRPSRRWTGRAVSARDLADDYGFTDVDGPLPAGPLRHRTV